MQENAVPQPTENGFASTRSPTSDFLRTQENDKGNDSTKSLLSFCRLIIIANVISAYAFYVSGLQLSLTRHKLSTVVC